MHSEAYMRPLRASFAQSIALIAAMSLTLQLCGCGGESPVTNSSAAPGANGDGFSPHPHQPITGQACRLGSQCSSGFCVDGICCVSACSASERCDVPDSPGRCASPAGNGAQCFLDAHCASGHCVEGFCCASASCPSGQVCNSGACGPPVPNGTVCIADLQCDSGTCLDGTCCATAVCPPGERCDVPGVAGRCDVLAPLGAACTHDVQCVPGSFCMDQTCHPLPSPTPASIGAACESGSQCSSGFCVDRACCSAPSCPLGARCDTSGHVGQCALLPTATPTITRRPTATATPTPLRPSIVVETASGSPGQEVSFSVTLDTVGYVIAGAQNDITYAAQTPILRCSANAALGKEGTAFGFLPPHCTRGQDCTSLRALVFSLEDPSPIADGSVLYTCTVKISADTAPGTYPLMVSGVILGTSTGGRIFGATGVNGAVVVNTGAP
jgi:hypothetical protein